MALQKNNHLSLAVVVFFGLLYCIISLVNHYLFNTFALDLGVYTNALYKYAHFKMADCSVFKEQQEYLLADHFDIYLVLFSPFVYLFGTYTLLVLQIAAVLLGGVGVYRYLSLKGREHKSLPLLGMICFYSFYGIYSAISFDYHSNVVAAMLVPWLFCFVERRNFKMAALVFGLILLGKENMALWMAFVCLGLLIEYQEDKKVRNVLAVFTLISLAYFAIVVTVVLPALSSSGNYVGFRYSSLGDSPAQVLTNLLAHPLESFKLLFANTTSDPKLDYVKAEVHVFVLLSGLYLLFFKPWYLLMLIPVYAQKLYHDDPGMWGIGGQYSIEFAPVLVMGAFSVMGSFGSKRKVLLTGIAVLTGTLAATVRTMDRTAAHTNKSAIRFYQQAHYENDYNTAVARAELQKIPAEAAVSALSPFLPHLALRDRIYQFPIIKDAEYIVYTNYGSKYPLSEDEFRAAIDDLKNSGEWMIQFENNDLTMLKRAN